ncbi:MAG TPA: helix-turn-helix transcriptional regulator [Acidimicrobiales bacterium]|nr:helix-turn-helix transcriptional regulator [Acidimicrobiales bacterium]
MDPLSEARDARSRQDWQSCLDALVKVAVPEDASIAEAERLDLLADAAWWLGRLDECVDAREQAYLLYDDAGDSRRAGQCAVWLYEHHCFRASPSIAGGWLRRARRALDGDDGCCEFGALLLREAEVAHGSGDLTSAALLAERGIALGRRLRSADLEAEALQTLGRVRIDQCEPAEGLALLDEAMLFVLDGRLGPYSTGKVYCSLISACEQLSDHGRAAEWTAATTRWAERHPFAVFPGLCRVHQATALQWRGHWAEAEREATRACDELAGINLPNAATAWAEIGDIRRRLGDLDGAADAFINADRLCAQPRSGLALLRLAQGSVEEATSIIAHALEGAGWNRLARAKVLPARVVIAVAAGDHAAAAAAAEELEAIAEAFASEGLRAAATTARGRVQLAQNDPRACATLRNAVSRWSDLGVPYDVATARTLLGLACRHAQDEAGAAAAFDTARRLFDDLGVRAEARSSQPASPSPALPCGLTEREAEVLRLVAAGHTNKEVAAALFLSNKTIARHLSNIFTKIEVSTRAAATAFAFEHNVIQRGA